MQKEKFEAFAEQKEQQEMYNIGDGRVIITVNEKLLEFCLHSMKMVLAEIA